MTAIRHRLTEMNLDWVVYVTDKRQAEHFYMCFEAARRARWLDDAKVKKQRRRGFFFLKRAAKRGRKIEGVEKTILKKLV
jgi:arginyl-tRNA synthetase